MVMRLLSKAVDFVVNDPDGKMEVKCYKSMYMIDDSELKFSFYLIFAELPYSTSGIRGGDKTKIEKALRRLNKDLSGCINIRFECVFLILRNLDITLV